MSGLARSACAVHVGLVKAMGGNDRALSHWGEGVFRIVLS